MQDKKFYALRGRAETALEKMVWVSLFVLILLALLALMVSGLQPLLEQML